IHRITENAGREVQPGADGEVAAPLPAIQNVREGAAPREPVSFPKGQLVNPVAGEFVALVKTGESAIRRDIEGVLRDNRAAAADRGSVVDRFGVSVGPRNSDAVRHTLAQANRCRVINGIGRRRFIDEGLYSGYGYGALDVEPRALRTIVVEVHHHAGGQLPLD